MDIPIRLRSRKLWVTAVGVGLHLWNPAVAKAVMPLITSYVLGQGAVDAAKAMSGKEIEESLSEILKEKGIDPNEVLARLK